MSKVKEVKVDKDNQKYIELTDGTKVYQRDADIEDLLFSAYQDKFTAGKTDNKTWISTFVDRQMDSLKTNLKERPEMALSALREINRVVNKTQNYFNSKKAVDTDFSKYLLRDKLFDWQRKVYDESNHKITMLCGRRSGKTHAAVRLAIKEALEKDAKPKEIIIIGLTVEKTAGLYWQPLKDAIQECHINVNKIDNGTYTITFANGNTIQLWGNNSKAEREKLRGKDTYMVIIDEMQSQQGLYYLMTDILGPIIRGRNGKFVLLGTGPISAGTYWETVVTDDSWSHFTATMADNPTIPDYQHALEKVLEENHWTPDNITFRREYLGEVAYDTERMIIPKRSYYTELPKDFKPTKCFIGVDYGWADYSSFAPILIDETSRTGYVVDEWKENKKSSQFIVDKMKSLVEGIHNKYNIPIEDIYVVADSSHQQISQDIYNQLNGTINIANAYKQDENYQWARLAEACSIGQLFVKENDFIDKEADAVVWQWNQEKGCIIYKVDDDVYHPDILDSLKYAWNSYLTYDNQSTNRI